MHFDAYFPEAYQKGKQRRKSEVRNGKKRDDCNASGRRSGQQAWGTNQKDGQTGGLIRK